WIDTDVPSGRFRVRVPVPTKALVPATFVFDTTRSGTCARRASRIAWTSDNSDSSTGNSTTFRVGDTTAVLVASTANNTMFDAFARTWERTGSSFGFAATSEDHERAKLIDVGSRINHPSGTAIETLASFTVTVR